MKDRAREIYDFLENLVANDDIPAADKKNNTGGIVLVGWSFAVFWIFALLGNVETFPVNDVELEKYVRRIVCHGGSRLRSICSFHQLNYLFVMIDPGCRVLGYFPEGVVWDPYSPLFDSTIPQDKMADALDEWLSGYFVHGQTLDTLERRRWLMDPSPTATRLTPDELAAVRYRPVVAPDGSETLLIQGAIHAGVCGPIKNAALYFPSTSIHSEGSEVSEENAEPAGNVWRGVEVRFLECTQTVWEGPYMIMTLQEEMDAARKRGAPTRDMRTVRVDGNHFVGVLWRFILTLQLTWMPYRYTGTDQK